MHRRAAVLAVLAAGCGSADRPPAAGERPVALASARLAGGMRVELSAVRDAAGPCLRIAGLPGGIRACGRAPSERVPPATEAIGGGVIARRSAGAELELYGETAASVRTVLLRYRLPGGRTGRRPATLLRIREGDAMTKAGIREPFNYFVGTVPPRASRPVAVARDRSGEPLGRLAFGRLVRDTHPTAFIATGTP